MTVMRRTAGDGQVLFGRHSPEPIGRLREQCVGRSLRAKLPKLAAARVKHGGESVLVLESRDPSHSSFAATFGALDPVLPTFAGGLLPDWLLVVETDGGAPHHIGVARAPSPFASLRYENFTLPPRAAHWS